MSKIIFLFTVLVFCNNFFAADSFSLRKKNLVGFMVLVNKAAQEISKNRPNCKYNVVLKELINASSDEIYEELDKSKLFFSVIESALLSKVDRFLETLSKEKLIQEKRIFERYKSEYESSVKQFEEVNSKYKEDDFSYNVDRYLSH